MPAGRAWGGLPSMTRYHFISGLPRSGSTLKEPVYGEHPDRLLLVDFDLLTAAPERVLRLIYEFVGKPWFEHDFENVIFDAPEFDQQLGLPGLHRVQPKVQPVRRQTVLPPDLSERLDAFSFWRDLSNSRARMIVAKREPHAAAAE